MEKDLAFQGHFSYSRIYKNALIPAIMMVFSSIYSIVDGIFVSNLVGKSAFAAVNIVMPVVMIFNSLGFMVGTGGTALVGKLFGEGKKKEALNAFSNLAVFLLVLGGVSTLGLFFALEPLFKALGANGETLTNCLIYGRVLVLGFIPAILQNAFQPFFSLAGKAKMGLLFTVGAGLSNMALDALFMLGAKQGLFGAALATVLAEIIGGVLPLIYFLGPNKSLLRIGKFRFDGKALLTTCWNGSSELLSNVSLSVVNILYNFRLMALLGDNGVASYGVIMYVSTISVMFFVGFDIGLGPIVSYKYGEGDLPELKSLLKKALITVFSLGVIITVFSEATAPFLAQLFTSYDVELYNLTVKAIRIYMASFLLAGLNFFSSSWFTALNDGLRSAVISFCRTLVFQVGAVLIMSYLFGGDGLWAAIIVSEALSASMSLLFLFGKSRYGAKNKAQLRQRAATKA